jgi:hypothetical protein
MCRKEGMGVQRRGNHWENAKTFKKKSKFLPYQLLLLSDFYSCAIFETKWIKRSICYFSDFLKITLEYLNLGPFLSLI